MTPSNVEAKEIFDLMNKRFIKLRRSIISNDSAIVELTGNNDILLNPRRAYEIGSKNPWHFTYGSIPELRDLDQAQTDQLWGDETAQSRSNDQLRTYKLVSSDRIEYFLDVVFEHTRFKKYRLRSAESGS